MKIVILLVTTHTGIDATNIIIITNIDNKNKIPVNETLLVIIYSFKSSTSSIFFMMSRSSVVSCSVNSLGFK